MRGSLPRAAPLQFSPGHQCGLKSPGNDKQVVQDGRFSSRMRKRTRAFELALTNRANHTSRCSMKSGKVTYQRSPSLDFGTCRLVEPRMNAYCVGWSHSGLPKTCSRLASPCAESNSASLIASFDCSERGRAVPPTARSERSCRDWLVKRPDLPGVVCWGPAFHAESARSRWAPSGGGFNRSTQYIADNHGGCFVAWFFLESFAQMSSYGIEFDLRNVREIHPFGKHCRSSRLVFSFESRCEGLCGYQK